MARLFFISILIVVLFSIGCQRDSNITGSLPNNTDGASVAFYFDKPTNLDTLVVFAEAMVSAPDMDTIVVDLTVHPNSVEGTIENIPAGPHRKFEIFTYDADTNLTYYGDAFADVPAGQVITLQIVLYPVNHAGTVIVVGTFAQYPSNEKIVFQADNGGSNDIYIMDSDGSNIINLTNSPFEEIRPSLSPDRNMVSFRRIINGISRPFVVNIDGGNLHELSILTGYNVARCEWSPDGQKVTFNAEFDGDHEIFTYDLNSGQLNRLTYNAHTDWSPTWSPQGDWIVYFSDEPGFFRIYKIRPDGNDKALINSSSTLEEKHPRISPDGNKVVFYGRENYGSWDIFIINLDGSNLTRLTNTSNVNETVSCWSPNGQEILFVRNDGTAGDGLYLMNTDGSEIAQLLDTQYNEHFPHWR